VRHTNRVLPARLSGGGGETLTQGCRFSIFFVRESAPTRAPAHARASATTSGSACRHVQLPARSSRGSSRRRPARKGDVGVELDSPWQANQPMLARSATEVHHPARNVMHHDTAGKLPLAAGSPVLPASPAVLASKAARAAAMSSRGCRRGGTCCRLVLQRVRACRHALPASLATGASMAARTGGHAMQQARSPRHERLASRHPRQAVLASGAGMPVVGCGHACTRDGPPRLDRRPSRHPQQARPARACNRSISQGSSTCTHCGPSPPCPLPHLVVPICEIVVGA
jgi:hypothetical protein